MGQRRSTLDGSSRRTAGLSWVVQALGLPPRIAGKARAALRMLLETERAGAATGEAGCCSEAEALPGSAAAFG